MPECMPMAPGEQLVVFACSNRIAEADALLAASPALATSSLFAAIATGEVAFVDSALRADPGLATSSGGPLAWPVLLYACFSDYLRPGSVRREGVARAAMLLLSGGANPNASYRIHEGPYAGPLTALYGAAGSANHPELAKALLDAGADPNDGESLYHSVEFGDRVCTRLLLQRGARVEGTNAVHHQLDFEDPDGLAMFLDHGVDPNLRDHEGRPLLHGAIDRDRSAAVLKLLLDRGADPGALDGRGFTPFRMAARLGHAQALSLLKAAGVVEEFSPAEAFLAACSAGDHPTAASLLARQPELLRGLQPCGGSILVQAAWRGRDQAVDTMLRLGFDPSTQAGDGVTALHNACWKGYAAMVLKLLAAGASVEVVERRYGATPLGWAIHGSQNARGRDGVPIARQQDYRAIVLALMEAGAKRPEAIDPGWPEWLRSSFG